MQQRAITDVLEINENIDSPSNGLFFSTELEDIKDPKDTSEKFEKYKNQNEKLTEKPHSTMERTEEESLHFQTEQEKLPICTLVSKWTGKSEQSLRELWEYMMT